MTGLVYVRNDPVQFGTTGQRAMHAGAVEPRKVSARLRGSPHWINGCLLLYIGACAIVYRLDVSTDQTLCVVLYRGRLKLDKFSEFEVAETLHQFSTNFCSKLQAFF